MLVLRVLIQHADANRHRPAESRMDQLMLIFSKNGLLTEVGVSALRRSNSSTESHQQEGGPREAVACEMA